MRANPGGQIASHEILGRDRLIRQLWRVLDRQSLILSAERRMGKTCVIKKMTAEAPQGQLPIYRDLEGIQSPLEFLQALMRDVENYLGSLRRNAERARSLLGSIGGAELGGLLKLPEIAKPHWKPLLSSIIEDLLSHQDKRVVFLWDEMPLMLYNIKNSHGETTAMELLDELRALRQTHLNLRMVFTGSVGIHNVIAMLKRAGYANDPLNDMCHVEVPPLDSENACDLAHRLLSGEGLKTESGDLGQSAEMIAAEAEYVPYFIHHIVDQIAQRDTIITPAVILQTVKSCITSHNDPWHLKYYYDRLSVYYCKEDLRLSLHALDALASRRTPLDFEAISNLVRHKTDRVEEESLRQTLDLLQRDSYILRDADSTFSFRFKFLETYWRFSRGIS